LKERKVGLDGTIRSNKLRSRHKKKSKHKDGPFVKSCAKFNKIKLIKDYNDKIVISKGDILEIRDLKNHTKEYFVFNGGGNISSGGNKLELDSINKKKEKGKRIFITLNLFTVVKPVQINFFGEIIYEDFKKS